MGARRSVLILAVVAGCTDGSTDPTDPTSDGISTGQPQATSTGGEPLPTTSATAGTTDDTDPASTTGESTTGASTTTATTDDATTTGTTADASSGDATSSGGDDGVVPDFELIDVNTNSATYNQPVSPRDYLEMVSGWYFTHAT